MTNDSKNSLRSLIEKRIEELEKEIQNAERNGAYATKNHLTKARNKNVELLYYVDNGGTFAPRREDELH